MSHYEVDVVKQGDVRIIPVKAEYAEVEDGVLCFYNKVTTGDNPDKSLRSVAGQDNLFRAFNSWENMSKID